ncbi:MAG: hypothetical protein ACRYG8_26985 [Janthinobacterium lividum]
MRDLSEILALRGIEVSYDTVRDWKTKLLPIMDGEIRKPGHGMRRGSRASRQVDRTSLKSVATGPTCIGRLTGTAA